MISERLKPGFAYDSKYDVILMCFITLTISSICKDCLLFAVLHLPFSIVKEIYESLLHFHDRSKASRPRESINTSITKLQNIVCVLSIPNKFWLCRATVWRKRKTFVLITPVLGTFGIGAGAVVDLMISILSVFSSMLLLLVVPTARYKSLSYSA